VTFVEDQAGSLVPLAKRFATVITDSSQAICSAAIFVTSFAWRI
jgi:hypothetical protein